MIRFVLLFLNALAFGLLVHRLLRFYEQSPAGTRKNVILAAGVVLLLLPVTMIMGFIKPTPVYLAVYPFGITVFIYLVRLRD